MSDNIVEVKRWENEFLEISLWSIKYKEEFYFFGKEVAEALKYKDPKGAIQDHVTDPRDKIFLEELMGNNFREFLRRSVKSSGGKIPLEDFFLKVRRNHRLLTEYGLYVICSSSRMEKAKPFKRWIFETIKTIRKTGFYALSGGPIDNPLDLIARAHTLERKKPQSCDKGTQTQEIFLEKFKNRLERSILRAKKIELELEKSLREIKTSYSRSNSSSYSSSSPRRSSSNSD